MGRFASNTGPEPERPVSGPGDPLDRIRTGDRDAAAEFLTRNEALIRRRYRQKMGRAMRRLCDSQELVSTIARRFDKMVSDGEVRAASERQLWALIFSIGDHALADKGRILQHLERVEGPDSDVAREWRIRFARAERSGPDGMEGELDSMLRSLEEPIDRQILTMWLMGIEQQVIASELSMEPAAVRKRWERIRSRLRVSAEQE
ncbi:MAG: hypothetical protein KF691_07635 [Phycisphaeraceae bacterium]|nr:hypothetical protein [Phycisphaeraceae bacterium]